MLKKFQKSSKEVFKKVPKKFLKSFEKLKKQLWKKLKHIFKKVSKKFKKFLWKNSKKLKKSFSKVAAAATKMWRPVLYAFVIWKSIVSEKRFYTSQGSKRLSFNKQLL